MQAALCGARGSGYLKLAFPALVPHFQANAARSRFREVASCPSLSDCSAQKSQVFTASNESVFGQVSIETEPNSDALFWPVDPAMCALVQGNVEHCPDRGVPCVGHRIALALQVDRDWVVLQPSAEILIPLVEAVSVTPSVCR